MAPPPSKRQRRRIVVSSDEEDDADTFEKHRESSAGSLEVQSTDEVRVTHNKGTTNRSLPTRSRTKPNTVSKSPLVAPAERGNSRSSSEDPPRKPKRAQEAQKRGSLHAYFNVTNRVQQQKKDAQPKVETPVIEVEEEDLIEDDSLDELQTVSSTQNGQISTINRRRGLVVPTGQSASSVGPGRPPSGSQKFLKAAKVAGLEASSQTKAREKQADSRPWAERYAPAGLEELVVHKKKVADVRNWLEQAFLGRERKRLLILKGPSGAGKTATVSTLSNAMDFEVAEWKNPINTDYTSEGYLSVSSQFEDFLGRSGNFASLTLTGSGASAKTPPKASPTPPPETAKRKVILIEEFPSTFLIASTPLRSFRSNILQHLAANPFSQKITPIILIITETHQSATTASNDSFTAHRLLGPDVLTHPRTTIIEFNPVAATLLTKALDLVIQKEARHSGRRRVPGPFVLKTLGEVGDVRNAIGSLEFLCLRADDGDDWGGRVASRGKKGGSNTTLTKMEKESLEMVTQRESSLGIFHALGKVVYNKRDPSPAGNAFTHTPEHLQGFERPMVSQVSIEDLRNETGTEIPTFIAALHENYILSCESPSFTDHFNACIDYLSDSDLLNLDRGFTSNAPGGGGGAESLRQDEIAFQVAVRGLLFALPYPVKRRVVDKGRGGEAFKMIWPMSLRVGRKREEVESLIDAHRDHSWALGDLQGIGHGVLNEAGYTEPFRTNIPSTKDELILERLPYTTKISPGNPNLEKIATFGGIEKAADEGLDDDAQGPATTKFWSSRTSAKGETTETVEGLATEAGGKLWLSDDDIEDD